MITPFERFSILADGETPSLRLSGWIEDITKEVNLNTPIQGSGSPEGVVDADPTQRYMDTSGSAGSILYIKQSGSGDTGWILV